MREEGVAGLYSGFKANLWRVLPACAITFTLYEFISQHFKQHGGYGSFKST